MQLNDAITKLAEALEKRDRSAIHDAEMALGDAGKVVPEYRGYRKLAEDLLEGMAVTIAFERAMSSLGNAAHKSKDERHTHSYNGVRYTPTPLLDQYAHDSVHYMITHGWSMQALADAGYIIL